MEGLVWQPVMHGAEMAALHGDPAQPGEYVIRFRTDREIFVPLHWHPHDESVRVINGPFGLSMDSERSELGAGSTVVIPAKVHHSTWYGAGTQVEVSGMGPFESIYVDLDTLEA
jgi:quercetin dioxygenase-like cupin family protein